MDAYDLCNARMLNRTARRRHWAASALVGLLLAFSAAAVRQLRAADLPVGPLPVGGEKAVEFAGVHNVFRLSEKLYNGSAPEREAGFLSLQRLGIKTIISVDGMNPDSATGRKYGMRSVHLPFGYDGCPTQTANTIVRAVRDLPGPIYIHCHHGKNRSPAGAAFARIALDGISNAQAVKEMERAGAGKEYSGLYGDVRDYRPPTKEELDRLKVDFREIAPTPQLVTAMVGIQQRFDRLLKLQMDGWKARTGTDAAYEALQLHELYTEVNRTGDLKNRPAGFRKWMIEGERDGKALEAALRVGKHEAASMSLGKLAAGCGSCHARYRNPAQPKR